MFRSKRINSLPLPRDLIALVRAGRWRVPTDLAGVDRVFPERYELNLYSLDHMPFENTHWWRRDEPYWIGKPDPANPPGDIDPTRSLLIGDLGFGSEEPIALDYRESMEDPSILRLVWDDVGRKSRWIIVAPNIRTFAEMLGL